MIIQFKLLCLACARQEVANFNTVTLLTIFKRPCNSIIESLLRMLYSHRDILQLRI